MKLYSNLLAVAMMMTCVADQKSLPEISEWKITNSQDPPDQDSEAQFTRQLETYFTAIITLKPGHTRKDVLKLFRYQAGLSTGNQRTFVFKQCYMIKVDVVFEPVDTNDDSKDVIKTISAPYLGLKVID